MVSTSEAKHEADGAGHDVLGQSTTTVVLQRAMTRFDAADAGETPTLLYA